ncbi:FAD-binding protein [Vibrio palustris]|uniref:3-(3-hydroxy-phenyl)propionate/3-hydroxycinnamic acid hydroxylase n=1 Tax=Vibrio palustris TaxID=1918946 RepID=A0A1R4B4G8_9VIBR|nr:FAD-binding protein [Vibrio palustris]SJL83799.1 3-(3-hydroxy-phenyl)propionate/3-hydroxycinnamic acid hydroxylase [Vibrio palustris]
MNTMYTDITIIGAGPVGLMCGYLAARSGLNTVIIDKSAGPLMVGRADALNARTLQLLELVDLFDDLYPLGKTCNTSSIWANGEFVSRQSSWWEALEGCYHRHFLMLGQSYIEQLLDKKLTQYDHAVRRLTSVQDITLNEQGCITTLDSGEQVQSRFVIGADGSHSFVRRHFDIPFDIIRPKITWAVIDGVLETDFPKVPEIIVFQTDTSDVAWIPREGDLDRFYIRMDTDEFTQAEVITKIRRAVTPHSLTFKDIIWYSQFTVKESIAEKFSLEDRVFLAGDAAHIHSVNGGQGLNTGLADAFNLIWKLSMQLQQAAPASLLQSYQNERQPIAASVIESSGELVRSTKYSKHGTHAQDYVSIVEKRAGNITGMGIRYSESGLDGTRIFDFELHNQGSLTRLYHLLNYNHYTLLIFSDNDIQIELPSYIQCIQVSKKDSYKYCSDQGYYHDQAILVRPDAYIESHCSINEINNFINSLWMYE